MNTMPPDRNTGFQPVGRTGILPVHSGMMQAECLHYPQAKSLCYIRLTVLIPLITAVLCGTVFSQQKTAAPPPPAKVVPAPTPEPDRKELWVPTNKLGRLLKDHPNAVMLDRAQYEALIRDAGRVKSDHTEKPPVDAVIENVKTHVEVAGDATHIKITSRLIISVLAKEWAEVSLLPIPSEVVLTKLDGNSVSTAKDAQHLVVRGQGRHEIAMEFQSPIVRERGVAHAMTPFLAWPLSMTARATGTAHLFNGWPMRDGVAAVPWMVTNTAAGGSNIFWMEGDGVSVLTENAQCLVSLSGSEVTTRAHVRVVSNNGPMPQVLRFALPDADTHVVAVDDSGVAEWKQNGNVIEITRRNGFVTTALFRISLSKPAPNVAGSTPLIIDAPRLEGITRLEAHVAVALEPGFEMTGWQTPGGMLGADVKSLTDEARNVPPIVSTVHFDVLPEKAAINVRRVSDRFSLDADLLAIISRHDLTLTRTLAFHGEEGSVKRAVFTLPAGEQFIALDPASGTKAEWKQTGANAFEIIWSNGLHKAETSTLQLRTRKELPAALLEENPKSEVRKPESFGLENVQAPEAVRLAGYVALDFDEAWKVNTTDTTGLETRDARLTPVRGRMAWFCLRDFKLALEVSRQEPVFDSAVTAFALPRARTVEIEGQITLGVTRAPLRSFEIRLPKDVAPLLRVDSPLIGERKLDDATGTWTLALRKELLGVANIRFHISLSAGKNEDAQNPQSTLTAVLPRMELPAARRFNGQWVVEANTDTELAFATTGTQPLDALNPPQVEGYTARHRVIAAYGYGTAAHEVKVTATRHESTRLISAVVEELVLTSVLASDGTARHEAAMQVRHSGDQFFAMRIPSGATLLSTTVDNGVVKPVSAGKDEVRVALPRNATGNASLAIKVIYETRAPAWGGSGRTALQPPALDESVPVLRTSWRVFAPEGYSYADPKTTLVSTQVGGEARTFLGGASRTFVGGAAGLLGGMSPMPVYSSAPKRMMDFVAGGAETEYKSSALPAAPDAKRKEMAAIALPDIMPDSTGITARDLVTQKLQNIIFPSVQFSGASIDEAIEFLRIKHRDLDRSSDDPAKRGINMILRAGAAPSTAQITLDLKEVPFIEALRYVTELAGMKYRIEPSGIVVIMPATETTNEQLTRVFKIELPHLLSGGGRSMGNAKEALSAFGIQFPEGASASYVKESGQLVVRNTQPMLDAIEALVSGSASNIEGLELVYDPDRNTVNGRKLNTKSGLLPLDLTMPAAGRVMEFHGPQKPEVLMLSYQSWERQMLKACLWLLLGVAAFFYAGRHCAVLCTLALGLLLTCLPLAFALSWLPACNAVLAGWMFALAMWLLWRVARWVERKGKELRAESACGFENEGRTV